MTGRLTKTQVRTLLEDYDLAPSRALGQNFLCDGPMIDKIVRLAGVGNGDHVVEIGPGLGSLTLGLLDAGAKTLAIEIDRHILRALDATVAHHLGRERLTVINGDARKVNWSELLSDHRWTVVANLPYNIATSLLLDLLSQQPKMTRFLVMVQREAGERLVAQPGSKIYGIPSVLARYWAKGWIVGSVPAELFVPKPNVESVLVSFERHEHLTSENHYDWLRLLVQRGFGKRRKMIRRSLGSLLTSDELHTAGVDPTVRAEDLTFDQWVGLADYVQQRDGRDD